jgi:hypothetical protein
LGELVRRRAETGIALVIRRSRVRVHGDRSSDFPETSQTQHLARHGIGDTPYEVLEWFGCDGKDRQVEVDELIRRMSAGTLGLIVGGIGFHVPPKAGVRLLEAARGHGVLIMVRGDVYDPCNEQQYAQLVESITGATRQAIVRTGLGTHRERGGWE